MTLIWNRTHVLFITSFFSILIRVPFVNGFKVIIYFIFIIIILIIIITVQIVKDPIVAVIIEAIEVINLIMTTLINLIDHQIYLVITNVCY